MKFDQFLYFFFYNTSIFLFSIFKYTLQLLKHMLVAHQSMNQAQQQMLPPNYDICFEFIKFAYTTMLVFLGFGITPSCLSNFIFFLFLFKRKTYNMLLFCMSISGFEKIKKIKDMKKKHSRAVQLVDELLQHVSSSKYNLKEQQQPSNSSSSDTNQNVKERSSSVKYENEKDEENKFSLAGSSLETTNKKDKGYFLFFSLNCLNGFLFSLSSK